MTSQRPYREALPAASASAELERCAGTQFDPQVVDAFLRVLAAQAQPAPAGGGTAAASTHIKGRIAPSRVGNKRAEHLPHLPQLKDACALLLNDDNWTNALTALTIHQAHG